MYKFNFCEKKYRIMLVPRGIPIEKGHFSGLELGI